MSYNVCSIIINESSIIITVAILFLSCGIPVRRTIFVYIYLIIKYLVIVCHCKSTVFYRTLAPIIVYYFLSHVYYICYFLLSMYGHQGNAGTLSHVISVNYLKR